MSLVLKGMTWRDPRGYDPLVACAAVWEKAHGVRIDWDQRSLQDFEAYPVADLARRYDLIVIDHPHVGQVVVEGCLMPLDVPGREAEREAIAAGSVGPSFESYRFGGRQWAFPIDAAAQVQAYRPDRLDGPVTTWDEVMAHARAGRVSVPLRAPHNLMLFMLLAANLGKPLVGSGEPALVPADTGAQVWEHMRELVAAIGPANHDMDPIDSLEALVDEGPLALMPWGYGYVSYARHGYRPHRVVFADIPDLAGLGPVGSVLGGTGIAVSALGDAPEAAIDVAYWLASSQVQRDLYVGSGGQPGHIDAWRDPAVNARYSDFFAGTLATLRGAWLRPRHNGYMGFQAEASELIKAGLVEGWPAPRIVDGLNDAFARSRRSA